MTDDQTVECRSSASYPGTPIALSWDDKRHVIAEVLSQWRAPQGVHFRVRTLQEQVFALFYDEAAAKWYIRPI